MNKKLKKGLTTTMAAAMGLGVVIPAVPVIAAPATSGWVLTAQGWTYYKSGVKATGWVLDGGKWYLLDSNGVMKTGWAKDAGSWYFLNASGAMATGWVKDTDGKWYFLKTSGAMASSTWAGNYYLSANGAMAVSTVTEDGWTVDANGAWDGHSKAADLAAATAAVVAAEASKAQVDIDAATALVAKLTVAADKTALTARLNAINATFQVNSVTAVSPLELQVKFNKPVNASTAINAAYYSINNTALNGVATDVSLSADKTTVTITLPVGELVSGTTYQLGVSKNVTDATSTAMASDYLTLYKFTDTVAPTLGSVTYTNNNTAKVTFSEPMSAITTGQVKVLDDTGADVTNTTPGSTALGLTANTTAGDTDLNIDLTGATVNKTYTVYVYGTSDLSGNLAGTKTFTVTKTNADTTAPTVQSVVAKSLDTFVVTFSEPITTDATTVANGYGDYTVNGVTGKLKAGDTGLALTGALTLSTDKTQLTVKLAAPVNSGTAGLYTVTLNNFLDLSQNKQTTAYTKVIDFEADTTAPKVVSTSIQNISGTDYLMVKFDDATLQATSVTALSAITSAKYVKDYVQYTLSGSTTPAVPFGAASLYDPDGDTYSDTIKIALPATLPSGSYTATLVAGAVTDSVNPSVATTLTFDYAPSATTVKPVVVDGDASLINGITGAANFVQSANDVTIKFSKDVTIATALNLNNYLVDGQPVFTGAIFVGDNKTVKLTLSQDAIKATAARLFTIRNVADADGNVMDTVTFNQSFNENVAPTIKTATLTAADNIVLTFSETVKSSVAVTGTVDASDFDVYVDGVKVTQSAAAVSIAGGATGTTVTLTLATPLTATDLTKTITVQKSSANDVVDTVGNAEVGVTATVAK